MSRTRTIRRIVDIRCVQTAVGRGGVRRLAACAMVFGTMLWAVPAPSAAGPQFFTASLNGAQQVPVAASAGTGTGTVLLNEAETQITVNLTFSGLSASAILAHIHGAAPPGQNAVVLFDFTPFLPAATAGSIPQQTFAITPTQVAQLKAGLFYFNIHTGNFPNGEIRGQITVASAQFTTTLSGAQQVPAVVSAGTGTGMVALNAAENLMFVNLSFSGLTTPAILAHIHGPATATENAGVLFDFAAVVPAATAGSIPQQTFAITPAQVAQLKAGLYYFNIHTGNFPNGEIRGQIVPPTIALDRTSLNFAATNSGAAFPQKTPSQTVRILQSGAGTVTWTATPSHPWITVSPLSGTGSATLTVGVTFSNTLPIAGTTAGSVTLAFAGAGNAPGPVTVSLRTLPNGTSGLPSGLVDTPTHMATGVTGSIGVTGWVVDDIGVTAVRVMRDPVSGEGTSLIFLGNAVLLDGARPDIAALFPTTPLNTRAGWGFLVLTNFLPNEGNGTFTLHAIADDVDGHSVDIGAKTITCTNSTAIKPFGAIDTPFQGETISGAAFANFGWVLSRGPALAFPPNGTVRVVVDGALLPGVPMGWTSRSDLTALFPALTYPGVTNALGVSVLNTTTLANGVHTIAWAVTDNAGQSTGVGSRFFTVANGTGGRVTAPLRSAQGSLTIEASATAAVSDALRDQIDRAPLNVSPILWRRGYDPDAAYRRLAFGMTGSATVHGEQLDRFELLLGAGGAAATGSRYSGYLRAGSALQALPIGSHLDPASGVFTWQPPVGFLRAYDFVFVRSGEGQPISRQEIRIVLNPTGSNRVGPQIAIDVPAANGAGAALQQPFVVAGWAIDVDASAGTGIDTLHVWAYPQGARTDPIFLGAVAYGGRRPDVAAIFGERFRESGYSLTVDSLPSGTYDIAVFAWSSVSAGFVPAKVVRVYVQ